MKQLGAGAADVAQLLPELRDVFPDLPEPTALDSDDARFRLFDSTSAFLRRAAAAEPLIVVLDDLHAADASSLLLLEFVAAELGDTRLLVLAAYRDPELETGDPIATALADVARRASVRISLGGLAEEDVAAYIELSAESEPSARLVAAIAQETEGNPLFVGEIVRLLATDGRLDEPTDAAWRPVIPETVKEVIGRRLQRLSGDCREILAVASVVGREFPLDVLEALGGRTRGDVLALVDEAVAARIVTDVPGSASRMRFTHALVRDTLYETLPPTQRRELHCRAAEVIEALAGADSSAHLSELAHHCFQALPAVDAGTAVAYARRAGDHARDLLAHEEAARLYESALQALELLSPPDPALQRAVLLSLGQALSRAGDMPRAKDAFLRAAALARAADSAEDLAAAALGYGGRTVWSRPARRSARRGTARGGAQGARRDGHSATGAGARSPRRGAARRVRRRRRVATGRLAVATARRSGDREALSYALRGLCAAQHAIGDHDQRLAVAAELREVARTVEDKEGECEALSAEMLVHAERNAFDLVRERIAAFTALAERVAAAIPALAPCRSKRDAGPTRGTTRRRGEAGSRRARARRPRGGGPGGCRVLDPALPPTPGAGQGRDGAGAARACRRRERGAAVLPLCACCTSHRSRANGRGPAGLRGARAESLRDRSTRQRMAARRRVPDRNVQGARRRHPRDAALRRAAARSPDGARRTFPRGDAGAMARYLGILAAMLDRDVDAIAHLRAAIEIDEATAGRPWVAYAKAELAQVLARRDQADEANALRSEASGFAAELGLSRLAARIDALPP